MKLGLMLPHFGDHCSYERVFGRVGWMEDVGFNSIWVRDHLSFHPHAFEGQSSLFMEPFTTLAGIATLTQKLVLGAATIITFRHPLVTSQLLGTLSYMARGNRVIAGIGAGFARTDFDPLGLPYDKRVPIVEELMQILRLACKQNKITFHGEIYHFDEVTIDPKPHEDTPIYYGGLSYAAVRRAVKYGDGWLPQRLPFPILDAMVDYMRRQEAEQNKEEPTAITYFPLTSIDRDSAKAREKIGIQRLVDNLAHMISDKKWKGISATEEALDGSVIIGSPQECVDQLGRFQDRGYDEVAFDLRNRFTEWEECLDLLGEYVVPHFK